MRRPNQPRHLPPGPFREPPPRSILAQRTAILEGNFGLCQMLKPIAVVPRTPDKESRQLYQTHVVEMSERDPRLAAAIRPLAEFAHHLDPSRSKPKNKVGRPIRMTLPLLVMLENISGHWPEAWRQILAQPSEPRCREIARNLGPGIHQEHVRRAIGTVNGWREEIFQYGSAREITAAGLVCGWAAWFLRQKRSCPLPPDRPRGNHVGQEPFSAGQLPANLSAEAPQHRKPSQ